MKNLFCIDKIKFYIQIITLIVSIIFTWGSLYNQLVHIKNNSEKALELSYKNSLDIQYIKGILKNYVKEN